MNWHIFFQIHMLPVKRYDLQHTIIFVHSLYKFYILKMIYSDIL